MFVGFCDLIKMEVVIINVKLANSYVVFPSTTKLRLLRLQLEQASQIEDECLVAFYQLINVFDLPGILSTQPCKDLSRWLTENSW